MNYEAPMWLPGGHAQTIWSALVARRTRSGRPDYVRERWDTPDGDFLDVDHLKVPLGRALPAERPLLVVFHGLEGSSRSHYSEAFAETAQQRGWACAFPHFRGCSGDVNLAPRAYHSGDFAEVDWVLRRFRTRHRGPLMAVGVSLGGNALLRWAAEVGHEARRSVDVVASICAPLDLAAGGRAIGQGLNRHMYTRMFMRTLVPKALCKLAQHPGLFDGQALLDARDLYDFDNVFTAPVHGFKNTEDYWDRASALPLLADIRVPALAVNARNDPFVPLHSLPKQHNVGRSVTLWQPAQGGHVGFPQGRLPGHLRAMPEAVGDWLMQHVTSAAMPHMPQVTQWGDGRHR